MNEYTQSQLQRWANRLRHNADLLEHLKVEWAANPSATREEFLDTIRNLIIDELSDIADNLR